jgi:transcriptional regulator with XRE-family HTH domain
MTEAKQIGARVVELRKAAGLTQVALAMASGVHVNTIMRVEAGGGNVTLGTLAKLACALDCRLVVEIVEKTASQRVTKQAMPTS